MNLIRTSLALALAVGLGVAASSATASHVPGIGFSPGPFNVNPSAVGEAQGTFSATYINFNYEAEVDNTGITTGFPGGTGTFTETGAANLTAFSTTLNGAAINAGISGLNLNYNLYAVFDAAGTVANTVNTVDGIFTAFNIHFFVDPDLNTTFNDILAGAPDQTKTVTTGTNTLDINVLNGVLLVGGFHVNAGLVAGDFDVQFRVTDCGANAGYFCSPGGLVAGQTIGDINGVNTTVLGVNPVLGAGGTVTDIEINGSGNVSFATPVPEPESLLLVGIGLAGMAAGMRRRKIKS